MAAWRPYQHVIGGELDNTIPGRVTGWISFVGIEEPVTFDLAGNFHRDIRGAKIQLNNPNPVQPTDEIRAYMKNFAHHQTGVVGDITAGLEPQDYGEHPYIEWYSDENGRVVLELDRAQVQVVGTPLPWQKEKPISRDEQECNMARFLSGLAAGLATHGANHDSHGKSHSPEPRAASHTTHEPTASSNAAPEASSEQERESLKQIEPKPLHTVDPSKPQDVDFLEPEHERPASRKNLQECQPNGPATHVNSGEPSPIPASNTREAGHHASNSETGAILSDGQNPMNDRAAGAVPEYHSMSDERNASLPQLSDERNASPPQLYDDAAHEANKGLEYGQNYKNLMRLLGKETSREIEVENERPLAIARLENEPLITLSAYRIVNGDLFADGEVTFLVDEVREAARPIYYRSDVNRFEHVTVKGYLEQYHGSLRILPERQERLDAFVQRWWEHMEEVGQFAKAWELQEQGVCTWAWSIYQNFLERAMRNLMDSLAERTTQQTVATLQPTSVEPPKAQADRAFPPAPTPVPECSEVRAQFSNTERSESMSSEQNNTPAAEQQAATPEQTKAPLYELQLGKLQGHVFQNQGEHGAFYSVSLFRTFTGREGTEVTSYRIREQDIPAAQKLLEQAYQCICTEREQTKTQAPENQLQVTRKR
jgi:hypothetical protein